MEFHASLHKFAVHTHRKGLKNSSGISARLRGGNANNRKRNSYVIVVVVVVVTRGKQNTRGTETKREKIYFCIFWITLPEAAPSAAFRHLIGAFNFPFIRMQPSPRATQRLTCKSDVSFFYEPACPLIIEFVEKFWTFPFHIYKFLVTNTILNPHIIYTYIYIVIRYILRIL